MSDCAVLIVAAGRGTRFADEVPKQYLPLAGVPVLRHSVGAFAGHPRCGPVRVVIHPHDRGRYDGAVAGLDVLDPVNGGARRQDSVRLGLESLEALAPSKVLIHDAARPLVDAATIDGVIDALDAGPGAIAAIPVTDSLKRGADGRLVEAVGRADLWRAQTPQGFHYDAILAAHRAAALKQGPEFTDDAAIAEDAGLEVALVPGNEDNFKLTTTEDLQRAQRLLGAMAGDMRTGAGFDVHPFGDGGAGHHVMLCGVRIDHEAPLAGHSDADVGLHALTDALLGACAAGDLGSHFPPSDPQWRGASSDIFVRHAVELIHGRGGAVAHVDITLICETPKIAPHREAMRAHVAGLLGISIGRVSVKATTTEKLGFLGRGEGIAGQAMATVRFPQEP